MTIPRVLMPQNINAAGFGVIWRRVKTPTIPGDAEDPLLGVVLADICEEVGWGMNHYNERRRESAP